MGAVLISGETRNFLGGTIRNPPYAPMSLFQSLCVAVLAGAFAITEVTHPSEFSQEEFTQRNFQWDGLDSAQPAWPDQIGVGAPHPVLVLGLPFSGTALLQQMMAFSFGASSNPSGSGQIWWADPSWQHANPALISERYPNSVKWRTEHKSAPIIVVRDPMSWLMALRNGPENELDECIMDDDWASKACNHPSAAGEPGYEEYPSIMGVWNEWVQAYSNLTSHGYNEPLTVRYEDLVADPEGTMDKIGKHLKLKFTKASGNYIELSDAIDKENTQSKVMEQLSAKSYLQQYSESQKHEVCSQLSLELMNKYFYMDCNAILHQKVDSNEKFLGV